MSKETHRRLEDLESRLAFQEHTIETLNQTVIEQQQRLSALERHSMDLGRIMKLMIAESGLDITEIDKPPHY